MKLVLIALLVLIVNLLNSQSTFFHYGNDQRAGISYTQIEAAGHIFIGGYYSQNNMNHNDFYIGKFDINGALVAERFGAVDTINNGVFDFKIYNDTILRVFTNYVGEPDQQIIVYDFDFNLNLIKSKSFHLLDSIMLHSIDNIIDKEGNYVICGIYTNHPYYPNLINGNKSFIFKISNNLDSLNFFFKNSSPSFTGIADDPIQQRYTVSTKNQFLEYYDYNFQLIKSLRADSMLLEIADHMYLDPNKILLIGQGLNLNDLVRHVVVKVLDTSGNRLNYIELYYPDTPAMPGMGSMLSYQIDSNYIYLVFHKNNNRDFCNLGEPSYIGVGKFDLNLNEIWISYFGNDSFNYRPLDSRATNDGGLIVTGYYEDCTGSVDVYSEFLLKVDSLGECTFMKELPFTIPSIKVFPNPATTHITIDLGAQNQRIETLNIFTITGQKAICLTQLSSSKPIDIQKLKPGIYLLEGILDSGERFVGKFVKE